MPPCRRRVKIDMRVDLWPARGICGVSGDNSAATAKWRWTCSHVADAAPEWPALLAATTTATPLLRADLSYPTVALFHVSLTLRKILKRRAPCSRVADKSVRVTQNGALFTRARDVQGQGCQV